MWMSTKQLFLLFVPLKHFILILLRVVRTSQPVLPPASGTFIKDRGKQQRREHSPDPARPSCHVASSGLEATSRPLPLESTNAKHVSWPGFQTHALLSSGGWFT